MRRMILTSLVLFPMMAHAQAGTSTDPTSADPKLSAVSAMNGAELTQPPAPAEPAMTAAAKKGGATASKVTRAVEMNLSEQELAEQPAVSNVVVRAIVDSKGIPRNVAVTKSGGAVIDRKAIEAVSQYRFQPATLNNQPTWATVSVEIKIQKP